MFLRPRLPVLLRRYSQTTGSKPTAPKTPSTTGINPNVQGLSSRCVRDTTGPVGPGASASGEYKVPEYFCYNATSYFEAEVELEKYRCPQPNANRK